MKRLFIISIVIAMSFLMAFEISGQDVSKLLFSKMDMTAQHELWDGNQTMLMGFTELMMTPIDIPSPTLIFNKGDSVEIKLRNMSQFAPHTIHLHGLDVDQQNDGVPHLSFVVNHMETKSYFFKAMHPGTYIYHCHVFSSLHVQAGMYGLLIIKPADGSNTTWTGGYPYDKEYAWMMSEIDLLWHEDSTINQVYDTSAMMHFIPEYNPQYFLVNGRSEHQLSANSIAIEGQVDERIYLRLANIGNYGNRIIFPPGLNTLIVSSDGRPLPTSEEADTVVLTPGERYGVMLYPDSEINDSIYVEYFDLNTQLVKNTQSISATISGFFDIENDYPETVNIYPNPANEYIQIENNHDYDKNITIRILDSTGRIVMHSDMIKNSSGIINTEALADGLYFIQIKSDTKIKSKKIIINH